MYDADVVGVGQIENFTFVHLSYGLQSDFLCFTVPNLVFIIINHNLNFNLMIYFTFFAKEN